MRTPATGLVKYDSMRLAIDEARKIDEAKDIRDKAIALETYSKQALDTDAERKCREIRLRAERRVGQLLKGAPESNGGRPPKQDSETPPESGGVSEGQEQPKTLKELGLSYNQSSQFQQLAEVPDEEFEEILEESAAICHKPITSEVIQKHKRRNGEPDYGKHKPFLEDGLSEDFLRNNDYMLELWGWAKEFLKKAEQYDIFGGPPKTFLITPKLQPCLEGVEASVGYGPPRSRGAESCLRV
jgi:hypothetical protein